MSLAASGPSSVPLFRTLFHLLLASPSQLELQTGPRDGEDTCSRYSPAARDAGTWAGHETCRVRRQLGAATTSARPKCLLGTLLWFLASCISHLTSITAATSLPGVSAARPSPPLRGLRTGRFRGQHWASNMQPEAPPTELCWPLL